MLTGAVSAQESQGIVRGRTWVVHDSTVAIQIRLSLVQADSVWARTDSGLEGRFEFGPVPLGRYTIRAESLFFQTTDTPITVTGSADALKVYVGRIIPDDELLFGTAEARRDVEAGQVTLLDLGIVTTLNFYVPDSCESSVGSLYDERVVEIEREYGFSRRDVSDEYENEDYYVAWASVDRYNEEVMAHLTRRNRTGWPGRMEKDVHRAQSTAVRDGCPALFDK